MNKRLIVYILGWVLIVEGAAMQIATVTSFIYGDTRKFHTQWGVGIKFIIN